MTSLHPAQELPPNYTNGAVSHPYNSYNQPHYYVQNQFHQGQGQGQSRSMEPKASLPPPPALTSHNAAYNHQAGPANQVPEHRSALANQSIAYSQASTSSANLMPGYRSPAANQNAGYRHAPSPLYGQMGDYRIPVSSPHFYPGAPPPMKSLPGYKSPPTASHVTTSTKKSPVDDETGDRVHTTVQQELVEPVNHASPDIPNHVSPDVEPANQEPSHLDVTSLPREDEAEDESGPSDVRPTSPSRRNSIENSPEEAPDSGSESQNMEGSNRIKLEQEVSEDTRPQSRDPEQNRPDSPRDMADPPVVKTEKIATEDEKYGIDSRTPNYEDIHPTPGDDSSPMSFQSPPSAIRSERRSYSPNSRASGSPTPSTNSHISASSAPSTPNPNFSYYSSASRSPFPSPHASTPNMPLGVSPQFSPGGLVSPLAPPPPGETPGKDIYFCHLCSYVGNSKFHFNAHMNSHFEHQCPHCDYKSRTEGRLKRHIKDFHSDDPPDNYSGTKMIRQPSRPKFFRCKQCEFVSETKLEFWEHARTHIKEDKILQCPKCPFVTEYKHHLEYHLRNHFGSKPFKCPKCNYSCVNKSMLNSHMKSHTNVYQYRCADCTYATKYCHSLKLHLRKYGHKAATVLNADGSLPIDGSGDFDLVSKRGPPRGPRGPRRDSAKDEDEPFQPGVNPMMLPPHLMAPPFGGGMLNPMAAFWPMMAQLPNGFPPPPLIPVSGISQGKPNSQLPPGGEPASKLKCLVCDFTTDNRTSLHHHMFKVHGAENQDLFNIFGLQAESMADEANKHAGLPEMPLLPFPMMGKKGMDRFYPGLPGDSLLPPPPMGWNPHLQSPPVQSPSKELENDKEKEKEKQELAIDMATNIEAEARMNGECPLDLTKREFLPSNGLDLSPGHKRPRSVDNDMNENCSESSPTPRKRSRKGKAYKLDTICMKLQERYGPESPNHDGDYDGSDEGYSDYSPRKADDDENSSPPPQDEHPSLNNGASNENGEDRSNKYLRPSDNPTDIDYAEIHNSLSMLNRGVDNMMKKYVGDDSKENIDEPKSTTKSLTPENESSAATFSSSINRRKLFLIRHAEEQAREQQMLNGHMPSTPLNGMTPEERALATERAHEFMKHSKANGNFECGHCDILFKDCIMYTMHMGYHGYQDPFKCNMCGHQSKDRVDFFLHIARQAHE